MGVNTLNNRSAGQTILDTFFNDIHQSVNGDFVGRNTSGVPEEGQNLGTVAFPWGILRASGIVIDGASVDVSQVSAPANRVVSGKKRSTSNQPAFIAPNGAAASFQLLGASTNLVVGIAGVAVSVTTDITKGSLTLAPSSNNTCLVNDTSAAGQEDTRRWGEEDHLKVITVDNMGSAITALIGKYATFRINGEYFLAFVESATKLSKAFRGYFYDDSIDPVNRVVLSNNDTISLMSTAWIFVENNATTVDVTYNPPVYDFTSPSSPQTGDYWFDLGNNVWKRYDGSSFQIVSRTFIGMAIMDTTACVAARSADFYRTFKEMNSVDIEKATTEIARIRRAYSQISVYGSSIEFKNSLALWNITTDLVNAADMYDPTEQPNRDYYCYVTDTGQTVISDISPHFRNDLLGAYHPHNPWRCAGSFYNDVSSDIAAASGFANLFQEIPHVAAIVSAAYNHTTPNPVLFDQLDSSSGHYDPATGIFTCPEPGLYSVSASIQASTGTQCSLLVSKTDKDGNSINRGMDVLPTGSNNAGGGTVLLRCEIGDTFFVYVNANVNISGAGATDISVYRVGN